MGLAQKARMAKNVIVWGGALLYGLAWYTHVWWFVILGTLVLLPVALWKLRRGSEGSQDAAQTLVALLFAAPINFAALVAGRRWGRFAILGAVVFMGLDLSYGYDEVVFPVIGWRGIFVVALVVGGVDWWGRKVLYGQVEDTVRAAVPGYTHARTPEITYGEGLLARAGIGRVQPLEAFSFWVPGEVEESQLEDIGIRLRQRLPAAEGSTWKFDWHLKSAYCRTTIVPDLPRTIWHPLADGSHGTPLAPKGDSKRILLGVTHGGEQIFWVPSESPHCFVVGATGGGKTVLIRGVMLHCFLFREDWKLYLIDLKRTELTEWGRYPGAVAGVGKTHAEALQIMEEAWREMDRRQTLLDETGADDLEQLNEILVAQGIAPLPSIMVIMDEVGILLRPVSGSSDEMKERKSIRDAVEMKMSEIAMLGRAMGVHLLYATQRTRSDTVPMDIRMNTQCRLGLGKLDATQSQMVFESNIAEKMRGGKGRGISYEAGELREIQTYRVEKANLREMIGVRPEEAA